MRRIILLLMFFYTCHCFSQDIKSITIPKFPSQTTKQGKAIVGFIYEGFESIIFPPAGWESYNVTGFQQWKRMTNVCHSGVACAMIDYESSVGEDWLVSPQFTVSAGDSLSFYMGLNYVGWIPDSLVIRVSTTDSLLTSFTNILMNLQEGVNYPPGNTTWYKYSVSLNAFTGQNIYLAFRHGDANGDGIYIDDVFIGSLPPNDVAVASMTVNSTLVNVPQTPSARIVNKGTAAQTFTVRMDIDGGYTSTQTVTGLPPGDTVNVNFSTWTPTVPAMVNAKVYTQLNPDAMLSNDTMKTIAFVVGWLDNYGWESKTIIPKALVGPGTTFYLDGYLPTDTGYVFVIGGNDLSGNSNTTYRYNTKTNIWDSVAPVPNGKLLASAICVKNKIYYIGGYNPSFIPQNKTYIYDIASDTWTTGANMITAVGDYACGVYKDSLIYIIGGWTGSVDINNVQIYNPSTNTWSMGTPKIGYAVDGIRGGIVNNHIIVLGGTSQQYSATVNFSYLGKINPSNPHDITWEWGPGYPFGNVSRCASGVPFSGNQEIVLFTGGDNNGSVNSAYAGTCAYDFSVSSWLIGPDKITPVNVQCDFPGIMVNDTIYNIVVSGFDGTNKTPVNEWLNLGSSGIIVSSPDAEPVFKSVELRLNYPNPFTETTTIPYFISKDTPVTIDVFDQLGRVMYHYENAHPGAGYHEIFVDLAAYTAGIYLYQMKTSGYCKTRKMIKQ